MVDIERVEDTTRLSDNRGADSYQHPHSEVAERAAFLSAEARPFRHHHEKNTRQRVLSYVFACGTVRKYRHKRNNGDVCSLVFIIAEVLEHKQSDR